MLIVIHLHYYAVYRTCSKEVLQAIIDHSASVNAGMKNNETCANRDVDAIDVLLKAGANSSIVDDASDTFLYNTAKGARSIQDLESFVDYCTDVSVTNIMNQSALVLLCENSSVFAVSVLKSLTETNIADTMQRRFCFRSYSQSY